MKALKTIGILVCFLSFGGRAFAAAEIQIFLGYRGYNDYDAKLVSDWDYVVSAAVLYFGENEVPTNAACFMGDPIEALSIFGAMVDVMNQRNKTHPIRYLGEVRADRVKGRPYLKIVEISADKAPRNWFAAMRECSRWSTPLERLN